MTTIQLDAPRRKAWAPDLFAVCVGVAFGAGTWMALTAWFAPPVRVEMAPGAVRRDWTITVKGTVPDRSGVVLVCEAKR